MKETSSSRFAILFIIIAILIVALVVVGWYLARLKGDTVYAVYLNTGDLYFGELSSFPSMTLYNAWYLQRDNQTGDISATDMSQTAWGSSGTLRLNRDSVVWTSKLSRDNEIYKLVTQGSAQ